MSHVIDVDAFVIDVYAGYVIDVDNIPEDGGPSLDCLLQMAIDEEAKVAEYERRADEEWDAQFGHCFPDLMAH
jgi:hypothetical protein